MMADLNGKLLDSSLKVPQTLAEEAALMGQNLSNAAKFKEKWGDTHPGGGHPRGGGIHQGA